MGLVQLCITFGEFYVSIIELIIKEKYHLQRDKDGKLNIKPNYARTHASELTFISFIVYIGPVIVSGVMLILFWKVYTYETPQYELNSENYAQVKKIFSVYYKKASLKNRIE